MKVRGSLWGLVLFSWAASVCAEPTARSTYAPEGQSTSIAEHQGNSDAAEAAFQRAMDLSRAGDFAGACPLFESSQALEPKLGTLLHLADCYEQVGRTASAWRAFGEAERAAVELGDSERRRIAAIRFKAMEPRLSWLTVRVDSATSRLPELELSAAGQSLQSSTQPVVVALDPGAAGVRATAPGYEPWALPLTIAVGPSHAVVDVPALVPRREKAAADGRAEAVALSGGSGAGRRKVDSLPRRRAASEGGIRMADAGSYELPVGAESGVDTREVVAWTLGGLGVATLGLGGFFGVRAVSRESRSNEPQNCTVKRCTTDGVELRDNARSDALAADVSYGVGAALMVAGVITYFYPRSEKREAWPTVSVHTTRAGGELTLRGEF